MSDPVMSPDGKHMWTGTEWIPAPPQSSETIVADNVYSESKSPTNTISDTVIMGDYTIQQTIQQTSDIENYMKTMIDAYKDGREERAIEIYELAKKIDYDNATSLYNGKYRREVSYHRSAILMKQLELIKEETKIFEHSDAYEMYRQREKRCKSLILTAENLYQYDKHSVMVAELFYEIWSYVPGYLKGGRYDNPVWLADQFLECGDDERSEEIIRILERRNHRYKNENAISYFVVIGGIIATIIFLGQL